ncbi:MAG: hypothetical protein KDG54_05720, partial [Geminicoccaceae bacterium]|nr:hypothetical protein [Geminicoccaceae bacterium]
EDRQHDIEKNFQAVLTVQKDAPGHSNALTGCMKQRSRPILSLPCGVKLFLRGGAIDCGYQEK